MRAEEILARLDEIRALIESHTAPDGTVPIDPVRVFVATEFCLTELRSALNNGSGENKNNC